MRTPTDGILNIVFTKFANLLLDRLYHIYIAIYEKRFQYKPWKYFTTITLYKLGKPYYNILKAYRPIALLNMMWKVLTGIVAEQLLYYTEKYYLLPNYNFEGQLEWTTTDTMHLLIYKIKDAWHKGKVASVLFLNIKRAFPNTVPKKLVGNLRKHKVPAKLFDFTKEMLANRATRLRFNDHKSDLYCAGLAWPESPGFGLVPDSFGFLKC